EMLRNQPKLGHPLASGAGTKILRGLSDRLRRLAGASLAILCVVCIHASAAHAANFTCSWNDATANWTVVADWSNCNATFPHIGTLDLDVRNDNGGGSLTIGGTLANTGTVHVGPNNLTLSAPTTLTLGGLTNASGANFSMFGSSSQPVTLAFSPGGSGFTSN